MRAIRTVGVTPLRTPRNKNDPIRPPLFSFQNNAVVSATYNFWVSGNALFVWVFRIGCKVVSDFVKGVY